ncbi:MAG TPA: MarR family transcriptional regulator [Oscillospiraceae bacterium]|nr:MarR family transcriptional regulator [Oscillospiraceae bacterium]HPF55320.1 MarR family transcriptional regulator [Clostridiales bacterium]HPK36096.1 MarR family transcriptional regulator [Oscillospiraceae bacterium]HPR76611.1 MarR family transcriptional regulator [Oscillospiraceae bacterium]
MEPKPLMLVIKHTYKEWTNYMRKMALECGIPDSYRMIIIHLSRHPGASQKDVAENCQKTSAAISQTVKEMQLTGYITKETDEKDQRFAKLYLTEKGQESADRLREKIHEADRLITSVVTTEKEAQMIEFLEMLSETIQTRL